MIRNPHVCSTDCFDMSKYEILIICLAARRKNRKQKPIKIVCHAHCTKNKSENYACLSSILFYLFICIIILKNKIKKKNVSEKNKNKTSFLYFKIEDKTGMICIWLVKWTIPSKPLSCCNETMTAAPAMKPIKVAFDKKSITKPNLHPNFSTF